MELAEKGQRCVFRLRDPRSAHAAARVERDREADRVVLSHRHDALPDAVVENGEVIAGEAADRLSVALDQRVDAHEIGPGAEDWLLARPAKRRRKGEGEQTRHGRKYLLSAPTVSLKLHNGALP